MIFYAPCPRGLEAVLADELRAVGATVLAQHGGGVRFEGDTAVGMAANLHSRIASRVLQQVAVGAYRDENDLYRLAHDVPWEQWHDEFATLRVDISAIGSPLASLQFATLRIKDGLVDRYRKRTGERPSIDTRRPHRRVFAFLDEVRATLYLDWSGEPLFKRGWRRDGFEAPLKENLAAGLLALSGWTPELPLSDPFCGSGTIAIEAASIAAKRPPGLRRRFGFERFEGFDRAAWDRMRAAALAPPPAEPLVHASDVSEAAVAAARANLLDSGLPEGWVRFRQLDAQHIEAAPAPQGLLLSNPPYGERLDMKGRQSMAQAERFWAAFGTVLKQRFAGWTACLFTSDLELPRQLRLKETRRTPLYNGAIECRLFRFEMYAGSRRSIASTDAPATERGNGSESTPPAHN